MKLSATRRRLLSGILALSLLLSLSGLAAPAVNEFRVFRIHGRRVHLRVGIPPQLNHQGIVRHLGEGRILIADRIGTGIGFNGHGTDRWLHVIDRQSGECGWVNEHFVEQIEGVPFDDPVATSAQAPMPAPTPAPARPESSFHDIPPAEASRDEGWQLVGRLANIANIIAMLLMLGRLQSPRPPRRRRSPRPPKPPAAPPPPASPIPTPSPTATASNTPNFIYGVVSGVPYRIPTKP